MNNSLTDSANSGAIAPKTIVPRGTALQVWPDFARALGINPNSPQAISAGTSRIHHGPLAALQRCRKVGPDGSHEWLPSGDAFPVDRLSDEGGILWRPACPGGPFNSSFDTSALVFYEIDGVPLAGQWEALDRLTASTGLAPAAVVFSGSKSLHVYFRLDRALDAESWKRLMRKLCIAADPLADPAIVSLNRAMRLPGAWRWIKPKKDTNGNEIPGYWSQQSIERLNPEVESIAPEDFESRLDGLGLWPHGLTDERWRLWKQQRHEHGYQAPALVAPDSVVSPPVPVYTPRPFADSEQDTEALAIEALSFIPPRTPGSGNYQQCFTVLAALVAEFGQARGVAIAESWSPAIKGTSWDPERKARTLGRSSGIGIGSLFHIAKDYGFRFPDRPKPVRSDRPTPKAKPVAPTPPKDGAIELYHSAASSIARGAMPLPFAPVSWFPKGDRLDKWAIASSVLDASDPGMGKTYDAGRYVTADRPGQTIYIANNHRNPDDDRLRHLPDLPSKHGGLVRETKDDRGRLTPYLRLPRAGETPTTQANCYHADSFVAAGNAGLILGTGKDSALCQQCPWAKVKWVQNEDGSESIAHLTCDYLDQRAKVLQSPAYRAHIDSIPLDTIGPETTFVIEEASTVLRETKTSSINANQIAQTEHQLRSANPDLAAGLAPVFIAIQRALGEAVVQAQADRWHGLEHEAFMGLMPSRSELEAKIPSAIVADWLAIDPWADGRSLLAWTAATVSKALAPDLKDLIDRHDPKGTADRFRKILKPRLLESLLKTIAGSTKHVYRVGTTVNDSGEVTGAITITSRDHRHRNLLSKVGRVILLDGTAHPRDIQRAIGRPVVTIAQQRPCYRNLTIKHVTGMGRLGAQRRTEGGVTQGSRVNAAIAAIKSQAPGKVAIIDYLRYGAEYEPLGALFGGHFTGDGRGSNRFSDTSDLVLVSKPVQNLGALHDRYMAERGVRFTLKHAPGAFWAWVQRLNYGETKQEADRLRSQLGDQPKTLWLLGDQFAGDIERLKADYPGATIETLDVMDIAPEGASKGRQTARSIISALIDKAKEVASTGGTLTQASIAEIVGCSVAAVSKAAKDWAGKGFKALKETLLLLYSSNNNKNEVFEPPPEVVELADRLKQLAIYLLDGLIKPDDAREVIALAYLESGETQTEQAIAALPARELRALRAIVDRSSLVEWLEAQVAIYGRARVTGNRAIEKLDDRELAAIAVHRHW